MKSLLATALAVVILGAFNLAEARDYYGRANSDDNIAFGITQDLNVPYVGMTGLGAEYATIHNTDSVSAVAVRRFNTPINRVSTNVGLTAGYGWTSRDSGLAYSYSMGAEYQVTDNLYMGIESRTYRTNFDVRGRELDDTTNAFTVRLRR